MDDDDVKISYSAKELLEGLRDEMREFRSEVTGTLEKQGDRITVLEQDKANKVIRRSHWRDAVILAGTVVMATGSAVGIVAAVHGL